MVTKQLENAINEQPILGALAKTSWAISKELTKAKRKPRLWDSDRALKSTHAGSYGKYQLRACLVLALGYGIVAAWLTEMPTFALLPPKYIDCTPLNTTTANMTEGMLKMFNGNTSEYLLKDDSNKTLNEELGRVPPKYNYSTEYGRSVLTDFNTLCDRTRIKLPHILYICGLIIGGLVFGYIADVFGRKMALVGTIWGTCVMSIFQLLSEDYISYVFFILFVGLTIGGVQTVAIPYIMEMFPTSTRVIYALFLVGIVLVLDIAMPWLAFAIKNWKVLQALVSAPLILTASLYWFTEESVFWHTSQKDYVTAVLSLKKIAQYNGQTFEKGFREADEFVQGDIKNLDSKYTDFDWVELEEIMTEERSLLQRIRKYIIGHSYDPKLSKLYPTDYFHSYLLTSYLLIVCSLWLASSLTEHCLDAPFLTQHLTSDFFQNYFYTHLAQIISFIIGCPLIYFWGRRWPTFFFFLIAEVCLLISFAVKLDNEQVRSAMLTIYFIGKIATRAIYIILIIHTTEIFPTGLRCTTLGICYAFRLIGVAIASPDVGDLNDRMPRLIYGVLALVLGALVLLLPETKKTPLPRIVTQIEAMSSPIHKVLPRQFPASAKVGVESNKTSTETHNLEGNVTDTVIHPTYPYDLQATLHTTYELQDFGQYDPTSPTSIQLPFRFTHVPHPTRVRINSDFFRRQESIPEVTEYDDDINSDPADIELQQKKISKTQWLHSGNKVHLDNDDVFSAIPETENLTTEPQTQEEHSTQTNQTKDIDKSNK